MNTLSLLSSAWAEDGGLLRVYVMHTPSMSAPTDAPVLDRFPRLDCPATSTYRHINVIQGVLLKYEVLQPPLFQTIKKTKSSKKK